MNVEAIIKSVGIEGARWLEERVDEQYHALQHLSDHPKFYELVLTNALISFQLSGRAEDWWWEFARWFRDRTVESLYDAYNSFLPLSTHNSRLIDVKLKRVKKLEEFFQLYDVLSYGYRFSELYRDLMEFFGYKKPVKTVSFAIKMYGYAYRIREGSFVPYPFEVPIPVDSRIERISKALKVGDPISYWNEIAKSSGVPPLHIDSILWVPQNFKKVSLIRKELPQLIPLIDFISHNLSIPNTTNKN